MNAKFRQRGLTLPELMVAILLGTIVTGAVIGMYLSTSQNFRQDERYALMQENGRYALRTLSEDLAMADFWGKMTATDSLDPSSIAQPTHACATGTPAGDDGINLVGTGAVTDGASTALLYNNGHAGTSHFTLQAGCTGVLANQRANTDLLVIKRVQGMPAAATGAAAPDDGVFYVKTNGVTGFLVDDGETVPNADESYWRYLPRMYFIRNCFEVDGGNVCQDQIPSLCRMEIVNDGGVPSMGQVTDWVTGAGTSNVATCIAEGIEDFHIQFGVDTDAVADGIANQYLSSPTEAQMEDVVSARIFVLARTSEADPNFTDTKTFALGSTVTLNQAALTGANFYRRVYTTTVMLRNPINLNQFQ